MAKKIKIRPGTKAGLTSARQKAEWLALDGMKRLNQGDSQAAETMWRRAVEWDGQCATAWKYLTELLAVQGRTDEALRALQQLEATFEKTAECYFELADKYSFLKQFTPARRYLDQALALNPPLKTKVDSLLLRAKIEFAEDRWDEAVEWTTRVLADDPRNLEALGVRQRSYFLLTWMDEDMADCRRYLHIQPDADRHSRLLFKLTYFPSTTPEQLYAESVKWNHDWAAALSEKVLPHKNTPDPERRLKIGYVSPDMRNHAVMKLLPQVLERQDKSRFEVFIYSIETQRDAVTDYIQNVVDHFVELPRSKEAIAKRVRSDQIDILVDIAGHTMHADAYLAFALKPAPLQVSWMGVLQTSGLSTMDYFFGDAHTPCPGTEHLFSEKVYRLSSPISTYRPPGMVPLGDSPCLANGFITFGSFNDPRKITRELVKMWSVVLHLHPGSVMLMKSGNLEREIGQRRLRNWFLEDGIPTERLVFEGRSKPLEYLASWNKVDIALDTYPYHGGTTTMDALWMGVPVVTMSGRLPVSCGGVGLLTAVRLPAAQTAEQYVALANMFAKTIPTNPALRKKLRDLMEASPLMDEEAMTRALENGYREIWRKWCAQQ